MSKVVDAFAVVLLAAAAGAFSFGIHAVGQGDDFKAIYLIAVGGLALRASVEILRPRGST